MAALIETGGTTWGVATMFSPLVIGIFILGSAAWQNRLPADDDIGE